MSSVQSTKTPSTSSALSKGIEGLRAGLDRLKRDVHDSNTDPGTVAMKKCTEPIEPAVETVRARFEMATFDSLDRQTIDPSVHELVAILGRLSSRLHAEYEPGVLSAGKQQKGLFGEDASTTKNQKACQSCKTSNEELDAVITAFRAYQDSQASQESTSGPSDR